MSRQRTFTLVAAAAVVLAAGGTAVAARAGDDRSAAAPQASASPAPPARVVLPGRPGESARVTDSDQVRAPDGSTFNSIDVTFVQMMIAHHQQAIEMSALAPQRAGDAGLRALAARIGAAQAPEITWLKRWLTDRKLPETDPAHNHSTMPGMQTPADLAALTAAKGTDFDTKFIAMMTAHHKGAIQMAGDVLGGGTDQVLYEMANEMAVEQGSEIRRMEQL
ncbi:DUF305 domain-containing protein [Actinoplanes friuliensis]|jgi:uncharacterized protein (DUF305 family)|uniref:DUF305 domain-containing protein n=1 Tax=Actinoplanes friuliensis DSM 7358 TaxID=1246995 RepID=U5VTL7_9ACTN|nr:DUF305 domain-containing protein [Actinoplanes friuliensis]AGZ39006.1 hypothetical protein AFR_03585 [Actinoplanes friuliensis DSM 7358]